MNRKQSARLAFATLLIVVIAGAGINLSRHSDNTPAEATATATAAAPISLVLNVPAHRLYVFENGEHTRTFRVSVGLRGYQTPAGSYNIRSVIWNPWWHPPNSGWARGRKPEPPGEKNPMGRVKLNFAPLLYIHGTVERDLLGDPASHGCVRMVNEDLIELTRLVHQHLTPKLSGAALAEVENNPKLTRTYNLSRSVPFEVEYTVANVRNGFLIIYPDVYRRVKDYQKKVAEALKAEGVDLTRVNWRRLEPLMEKGRTTRVAISMDEVLLRGGARGDAESQ